MASHPITQPQRITLPLKMVMAELLRRRSIADESVYGLEIATATKLRTGTVYPILWRAEEAGWVISEREEDNEREGGGVRRYYRLTESGVRKALELTM